MNFDLSKMKKVSHDEKSATFRHPDGHTIKIATHSLSEKMRKQLGEIPVHDMKAEGGEVKPSAPKEEAPQEGPKIDKEKAVKVSQGFNSALGFAEGGETPEEFIPGKDYKEAAKTGNAEGSPPININIGTPATPGTPIQPEPNSSGMAGPEFHAAGATPAPEPAPRQRNMMRGEPVFKEDVQTPQQAQPPEQAQPLAPAQPDMQAQSAQQAQPQAPAQPQVQAQPPSGPQKVHADFLAEQQKDNQAFASDLQNGHITPETYRSLSGQGHLGKIGTIFGLLLSGAGSGLSGQPNALLAMMDKEIDHDLEAQKTNQQNKFNLYTLAKKQILENAQVAHINFETAEGKKKLDILTKNEAKQKKLAIDFHDLKTTVDNIPDSDPAKKAAAVAQLGLVYNAVQGQISNLADINAGIAAQHAAVSGEDPSTLVPGKVPQHLQQKVFDEIAAAQDTKKNAEAALSAFDRAVSDTRAWNGGAFQEPGSVGALHQALGPTFKDVEGTVRQAAMDNSFKNLTPSGLDTPTKSREKRAALIRYLTSKSSAPVAKGFGIDLSRFPSTHWEPTEKKEKKSSGNDSSAALAWANAHPDDPRSKTILGLVKGR